MQSESIIPFFWIDSLEILRHEACLLLPSILNLSCAHRSLSWELPCASVYLQFQERKCDN